MLQRAGVRELGLDDLPGVALADQDREDAKRLGDVGCRAALRRVVGIERRKADPRAGLLRGIPRGASDDTRSTDEPQLGPQATEQALDPGAARRTLARTAAEVERIRTLAAGIGERGPRCKRGTHGGIEVPSPVRPVRDDAR